MPARRALLGASLAAVLIAVGCGGDGGESPPTPTTESPRAAAFPKPEGRGLQELIQGLGEQGPVLAQAVSEVRPGRNRFAFGLFDRTRKQISQAPVALYLAPKAGGPARGPYEARWETMQTEPRFRSKTVATDADAATAVYVSQIEVPRAGDWYVVGLLRLDDRLVPTTAAEVTVRRSSDVPEVGERPPTISTPTAADVSDIADIETREPPDSMHDVDFAEVAGRKPVVIVFSTPALCQSRVCGPVVDIAEQVKARHADDDIAWIHMEVYRDNDLRKGYRRQLAAWNLRTEPWAFTLDRSGRVAARLEGAWSPRELEAAVRAATG